MTDFIKTLTRKNSLRKQCQELGVADLEKVISDLNDIVEEKREEEAAAVAAEAAKLEAIEAIRKQMLDAGIDLTDLSSQVEAAPRKSVKAKFRIVDAEGEEHFWSGRGRTPVAFAAYMEAKGISKDQLPVID